MTAKAQNLITAGKPGEVPLASADVYGVHVQQMPNDELCLRVSIGEATSVGDRFRYLVFRGDPDDVLALLQRAKLAMEAFRKRLRKSQRKAAKAKGQ